MTQVIAGAEQDESLVSIVYTSSATCELNAEDLEDLLDVSRRNNQRDSITGMLLHVEGNFMQAIEGPPDRMRDLYRRLERDQRQRGLIKLIDEPIAHRQFAGWSMAFRQETFNSLKKLEGFSDFLQHGFDVKMLRAQPGKALKLLLTFREVTLACG